MKYEPIPEIVDGLPNISGWEAQVEATMAHRGPLFVEHSPFRLDRLQSAFGITLHMHQPLVLDDGDLQHARVIGNLQYMMERQHVHGNHDAPVFASCYTRIADFLRELANAGRHPRVMLDYSGELLFALRQMQRGDIIDNLRSITVEQRYWPHVEWLGTMWGHAVVPSTPVPDVKLHVCAWQHQFAAIFGWEALGRVRGFSPPEMHLPNHPDVCFEYVKTLRDCGYQWLAVQEHSVEETDGHGLRERYLPRRLIARNSKGEEVSITALIKTQGSDTKLVGQMQPYHEAKGQQPRELNGKHIPPLVFQISDGENGGVMMNEFPQNYNLVWQQIGTEGVVGLNGTEYLELLAAAGVTESDFAAIQPLHQHRIWKQISDKPTPERVNRLIEELRRDHRFSMEGASWTNNLSWVRGYENVLDPMNKLSALFHEKTANGRVDKRSHAYRNALFYLLASQTSCYRYWGTQGRWTDYARELCRRGTDILNHDL